LEEFVGLSRADSDGSTMKSITLERLVLVLLIVYCLDLAWKLANWRELSGGLDWWMIALGLTIRFAFMVGLLFLFIRTRTARKSGSKP
jgi:hypothetical protein